MRSLSILISLLLVCKASIDSAIASQNNIVPVDMKIIRQDNHDCIDSLDMKWQKIELLLKEKTKSK